MPTSDVSRWHRFGTGADVPEPVVVRCARCGFFAKGELEQAREAFAAHECADDRPTKLQQLGDDRFF